MKVNGRFFFNIASMVESKLYINGHWIVPYNVNRKSNMAVIWLARFGGFYGKMNLFKCWKLQKIIYQFIGMITRWTIHTLWASGLYVDHLFFKQFSWIFFFVFLMKFSSCNNPIYICLYFVLVLPFSRYMWVKMGSTL